ncbi:hypothetical protein K1718_09515 [Roseibium porphyridii]|uniref:Uncharacterized protein n=1 Tax=Roseibium porphyridii TaxID=2866279 RepID=A0ABY8FCJ5_9HYPH|nr:MULTISPECIES: hypothetical protein [Stappiaceae]QFT30955.1 hypothetical protein FIV00_10745 [Labrenzia sp. THAF82]WFE91575.1 hypothetical protein K1718_09515 [Roseibium sp. KMA01]
MASGGIVDRIAAEYGVHFVTHTKRISGRHQSKARRTCQTLLNKHGAEHLRLVFGLINTAENRGNWSAPCVTAVSWLVLNKPEWIERRNFLDCFDQLDLEDLMTKAKEINPGAPTITLAVLLSYELEKRMASTDSSPFKAAA